jgi:predicted molibdopterin-dependent oxidoreductase YjgC
MLLGTDPQDDFPDHSVAEAALNAAGFTIAIDAFITDSTKRADVFLPVTLWGEKAGSVTNLEGRVQRAGQKVSPDGTPMPDWRIAAELALRLGVDFDLELPEEVQDEIARVAPAYAGIDAALLRRARDGAVAPIAAHPDELVLGPVSIPLTDARWEPIRPGLDTIELEDAQAARDEADARAADRLTSVAATTAAPAQPALHRWSGDAGDGAPPARDAYALRLVTGRTLYDGGITVAASGSLAALVPEPVLLINAQDRDRIGVEDGAEVRVTSSRGSLTIGVRADARISIGSAYLPFNLPGGLVNDLVDLDAAVTDLRVESLS